MTTMYVKKTGADSNNGTTWALAKATIGAGLAAVPSGGSVRVIVAPGRYLENGLYPANLGASTGLNTLVGDYGSTISDGTTTSGVTPGHVILDSTMQSGYYGQLNSRTTLASHDQWRYWSLSGMCFIGSTQFIGATNTNVAHSMTIDDCIFYSTGPAALIVGAWHANVAASPVVTIRRSVIVGAGDVSVSADNGAGILTYWYWQSADGTRTAGQLLIDRCVIVGTKCAIDLAGVDSNYLGWVDVRNSTLVSHLDYSSCAVLYDHSNNAATRIDCYDSALIGYKTHLNVDTVNLTRCKTYLNNANNVTSSLTQFPLLPGIPFLFPDSQLIDVSGTASNLSSDLFGSSQQGSYWDVGAQEYVAGKYPQYPVGAFPSGTTSGKKFSGFVS